MLKVVLNSLSGIKSEKPFTVLVESKTSISKNRIITRFTQTLKDVSGKEQNFIGCPRQVLILEDSDKEKISIPSTLSLLQSEGEERVKSYLEGLKLPQVVSISII